MSHPIDSDEAQNEPPFHWRLLLQSLPLLLPKRVIITKKGFVKFLKMHVLCTCLHFLLAGKQTKIMIAVEMHAILW